MSSHFLFGVLLIALVAACGSETPKQSDMLRNQLEEDWKYWMTQYPEVATSVGYPGQNMRWTDYSRPAIDARAEHLKKSFQSLSTIDRTPLAAEDQINYDLYRDLLETAIQGLDFHNDALPIRGVIPHNLLMPMNQLEGIQQDIARTFATMPAETREDYENIVLRLERIGPLVDQTIALMEEGIAAGMTPPRATFRNVPDQVKAQIFEDPLKSPMLEAFTKTLGPIAETERASLTGRAMAAYRQVVVPAFTKLHDFLVSRYLPACRETTDVRALPNGASMYAYNVKWHTTLDKTPEEIHEIGLSEVKRLRAEMDKVITDSGFKGNYEDFKKFMRTSPQFYFKDASSLLAAYRDIAKRADPELARLFGRLPQTPYGV